MAAVETLTIQELHQWADRCSRNLEQQDFRKALNKCLLLMRSSILDNFNTGTAPDGTPWPPLKQPRANSRGGDKPLRDRGFLMAASTGGAGGSTEVTNISLVMSNNLEYAGPHQYGATILVPEIRPKNGKALRWFSGSGAPIFSRRTKAHTAVIPQRQFMGFKDSDVEKIGLVFGEDLDEKVK